MHQLPEAFRQRIAQQLGAEASSFFESLNTESPVSIRINPGKYARALSLSSSVLWSSNGYYLPERPVFTLDPLLHAGAYYVQEASSMFLEQFFKQMDRSESLRILDLCAAPGGKSTLIASLLNENDLLVSNEVIKSRAYILKENILKWGNPNVLVTQNDPEDFQKLEGVFDIIVVDAPCSGEGLFRKDPEAAQEWSTENVLLCSQRQQRILADVWPALKENGVLIYSTCTYNEEENENILKWLSSEYSVEAFPELILHEEWGVSKTITNNISGYHFFPHRTKGEGLFMTAVIKKEETDTIKLKVKKTLWEPVSKNVLPLVQNYVIDSPEWKFKTDRETIYALPAELSEISETIASKLNVVHKGVEIGEMKHKDLIPAHGLALSTMFQSDKFNRVTLDKYNALKYLHKDDIVAEDSVAGWNLVQYEGLSLGWVKKINQRFNNYYPTEWRIRMDIPESLK